MSPARVLLVLGLLGCGCGGAGQSGAPSPATDSGADARPVVDAAIDTADAADDDPWSNCKPRTWKQSTAVGSFYFPPESVTSNTLSTLLPDGRVLLSHGGAIYDPVADSYELLSPPEYRLFSTATVMADGRSVLLAGGSEDPDSASDHAEMLDLVTKEVRVLPRMLTTRRDHRAVLLPSGKVLLVGGRNARNLVASPPAEIFDPLTSTWTASSASPDEVGGGSSGRTTTITPLPGEKFLITEPSQSCITMIYDPRDDSWERIAGPKQGNSILYTARMADGRIFVGGNGWCFDAPHPVDAGAERADIFDPVTRTWTPLPLPGIDLQYTANAQTLPCGAIAVMGRDRDLGMTAVVRLFDPKRGRWFELPGLDWLEADARSMMLPDGRMMVTYGKVRDVERPKVFPLFLASTSCTSRWRVGRRACD